MASAVGPLREAPSRRKRSLGVPPGLCAGGRGRSRALAAGARGAGGVGAASAPPSFAARPRRRPGDGPARPGRLLRGALTRARPGSVPAPPPPSPSPCRGGRLGPTRGRVVACAAAPRGCVPRRRPAGRRGVVRRRALSPGLRPRRAALRAGPRAPRRGRLSVVDGGARRPSLAVAGGVSRLRGGWCAALASRERERERRREERQRERVGNRSVVEGDVGGGSGVRGATAACPHPPRAFHARRPPLSSPLLSPRPLPSPLSSPLLRGDAPPPGRARCRAFSLPPDSPRPVRPSRGRRLVLPSRLPLRPRPSPRPARRAFLSPRPRRPRRARAGEGEPSSGVVVVVGGVGGVCVWGVAPVDRGSAAGSLSFPALSRAPFARRSLARSSRARVRACALRDATSDQTWRPAEFKHISQRRKRN